MAKDTHFQNWRADNQDRDRCPVCWNSMGWRSRSNYCSDRCVAIGKSIRDRVRDSAIRFQVIGFTLAFIDGIYPELQLPFFMGKYYPDARAKIYPVNPRPIGQYTTINPDFWGGMTKELGSAVCGKIATVQMKSTENVVHFRQEFDQILSDMMFLQEGVFICPDCGGKYFDGELTRGTYGKPCCDFVQAKMPF